jgi:hypothetical protein
MRCWHGATIVPIARRLATTRCDPPRADRFGCVDRFSPHLMASKAMCTSSNRRHAHLEQDISPLLTSPLRRAEVPTLVHLYTPVTLPHA